MNEERAVDTGAWDGSAAMSACANSDDPAAAYRAICAGRRAGDPDLQSSWALPHHSSPGDGPNAAGVRNALSRLPQTEGLTNREAAQRHLDAHMAEINPARNEWRPVHENLYREMEGYEFRDAADEGLPILSGHFSVFDQWTTIASVYEGQFRERIAQGAWTKTLKENRDRIRMLFNHGKDILGNQVIAVPIDLREDGYGGFYESEVLEGVPQLIVSGLRRKQYGASMRFRVTREEVDRHPKESDGNPEGLPERTVREAELMEFGPVTFAAYPSATATLRSLTDDYVRSFSTAPEAPSTLDAGDEPHLEPERREPVVVVPAIVPVIRRFRSDEDWHAYLHKEFR